MQAAQFRRVLLGTPDRHAQELGGLRQPHGVIHASLALEHGWQQPVLVIDQNQLAVVCVHQHGLNPHHHATAHLTRHQRMGFVGGVV